MRCLGDIALLIDVKPGDVIHAPNNRIYYVLDQFQVPDTARTLSELLELFTARTLPDTVRILSVLLISSNDEPKLFEQHVPRYANDLYPFVWGGVYMVLGK